ncbi:MAG: type II toxin-antitoxin system PrlF family antitoxin [Rhodoferax sp.]|nr:type II toxin-antitoxin system PrlF family antitoxin [Rhodoferax sp.]MCF8210368.1 type II toxin-antitoxin system PrlF family antitoxin [Rhodoferax sp.]
MFEATLTSKGQITTPANIRKSMSIGPKDRLTFTPMPDGTVVMRAKTKSLPAQYVQAGAVHPLAEAPSGWVGSSSILPWQPTDWLTAWASWAMVMSEP